MPLDSRVRLTVIVDWVQQTRSPGSLNEAGTPTEFLAGLQKIRTSGPADIKTRQVVGSLKIEPTADTFTVTNNSRFFIDQLSFSCEVARGQAVYFTWDVGFKTKGDVHSPIDWLVPHTTRQVGTDGETLTLLHNAVKDYENLGPKQVSWLLHKYPLSNCHALDVSDATEDDPIKRQAMIDKCHEQSSDLWVQAACVTEGDKKIEAAHGDAK
jgi:hypothetical protein